MSLTGVYCSAKSRCEDPEDPAYLNYGARGIRFLFPSKTAMLAELGVHPGKGYSLDRPNPWGNYESGNVQWATQGQQELHKRCVILELRRLWPEDQVPPDFLKELFSFIPE